MPNKPSPPETDVSHSVVKRHITEESREPGAYNPEVKRESDGKWKKGGGSPCPGGRALSATLFSRKIKEMAGKDGGELVIFAFSVLRGTLKFPMEVPSKDGVVTLETVPNVRERLDALKWLRENGWGKALPASEMIDPEELPEVEEGGNSAPELLERAQRLLGKVTSYMDARMQAGAALTPADLAAVAAIASGLSGLQGVDEKLAKSGPGASMGDEELRAAILRALPLEVLRAEVEKRSAEVKEESK